MHPFFFYNYFLFFYKNQELFCDAQLFLIFRKGAIKLSNQIKSNICPEQALSVRLCVYVCVCVSVTAFHFNTIRPILIKLRPIDLIKYLRWRFSQILKILLWWRHGGYFVYLFNAALSFSQLCFDFLQIHRQEILISSNVCYRKLAKSVNNFRSKKRTAFTKNRFLVFQPVSDVPSSISSGDKSFAT